MVEIVVIRDPEGHLRELSVEGHAEFDQGSTGGDIVCAAVSALVGYLGIAYSEVAPRMGQVWADDGVFRLVVDEAAVTAPEGVLLLETWVKAACGLEENYRGWVKVEQRKSAQETA
ncbi:MAG: ribosomal-processing cysteine protease Prp [Vulcanimicrobiota bacterium]